MGHGIEALLASAATAASLAAAYQANKSNLNRYDGVLELRVRIMAQGWPQYMQYTPQLTPLPAAAHGYSRRSRKNVWI
jgi:hypothetical protein